MNISDEQSDRLLAAVAVLYDGLSGAEGGAGLNTGEHDKVREIYRSMVVGDLRRKALRFRDRYLQDVSTIDKMHADELNEMVKQHSLILDLIAELLILDLIAEL